MSIFGIRLVPPYTFWCLLYSRQEKKGDALVITLCSVISTCLKQMDPQSKILLLWFFLLSSFYFSFWTISIFCFRDKKRYLVSGVILRLSKAFSVIIILLYIASMLYLNYCTYWCWRGSENPGCRLSEFWMFSAFYVCSKEARRQSNTSWFSKTNRTGYFDTLNMYWCKSIAVGV